MLCVVSPLQADFFFIGQPVSADDATEKKNTHTHTCSLRYLIGRLWARSVACQCVEPSHVTEPGCFAKSRMPISKYLKRSNAHRGSSSATTRTSPWSSAPGKVAVACDVCIATDLSRKSPPPTNPRLNPRLTPLCCRAPLPK